MKLQSKVSKFMTTMFPPKLGPHEMQRDVEGVILRTNPCPVARLARAPFAEQLSFLLCQIGRTNEHFVQIPTSGKVQDELMKGGTRSIPPSAS